MTTQQPPLPVLSLKNKRKIVLKEASVEEIVVNTDSPIQAISKALDETPVKAVDDERPILWLIDGNPEKIHYSLERLIGTLPIVVDPSKNPLTVPTRFGRPPAANVSVAHQQAFDEMKILINDRASFILNAKGFTTMVLRRLLQLAYSKNYIVLVEKENKENINTFVS